MIAAKKFLLIGLCSGIFFLPQYIFPDPIHDAAGDGNQAELERLIDAGVDVNAKDENGWTPLMFAAWFGHMDTVRFLLEVGAEVDIRTHDKQYTPLIFASLNGHEQIVRLLIEAGADLDSAESEYRETALMLASERGHTDIVRLLMQAGADLEARDITGFTALVKASQKGETNIARLLLSAGADVNARGSIGATALILASEYGHTDIARLLIDAGAHIDNRTNTGMTALMFSAYHGNADITGLLLEHGADLNARTTPGGYTAVLFAALRGQAKAVDVLEASRASRGYEYDPGEAESIPGGITYIKATDERNKEAEEYLLDVFYKPGTVIFLPEAVYCGPFFWNELVSVMGFDGSVGIPMQFRIPTGSGIQELEGRVIRWQDQTKKLQAELKALFRKLNGFTIRKLSENEMSLYWSMIPYDIEKPIFVIESPGFLLLVDIGEEGVFFMENFYRPLGL